jgi:hypothetical protein
MPTTSIELSDGQNDPLLIVPAITKAIDTDTSYTCFMTTDWNGCLVVYAQTAIDPSLPDALRADLLARGYALAIARCEEKAETGQDKTYHIQQIQGFFSRRCGTPEHVREIGDGFDILPPVMKR